MKRNGIEEQYVIDDFTAKIPGGYFASWQSSLKDSRPSPRFLRPLPVRFGARSAGKSGLSEGRSDCGAARTKWLLGYYGWRPWCYGSGE